MEPTDLAENGREVYGWRLMSGVPAFVVVEIGFTVAGQPNEPFEAFKTRMLTLSDVLCRLGYTVNSLVFQRRRVQNRRHWAEFTCLTPETEAAQALPVSDQN